MGMLCFAIFPGSTREDATAAVQENGRAAHHNAIDFQSGVPPFFVYKELYLL